MKLVNPINIFLIAVYIGMPALAQTSSGLTLSPSEEAFFIIQPYVAQSQSEIASVKHFGVETARVDDSYVVRAVLNDFPGAHADIRRGDRIISVNGTPFGNTLPFGTGALDVTNNAAPLLTVELERDDQPISVEIQAVTENMYDSRRTASLASVQEFSAGNKTIAYFHPWSLSRNFNDLQSFLQVIDSLAGTDGLILDLRDSYGFLSIHHIDAFLPSRQTLFRVTGNQNVHTQIGASEPPLQSDYYGRPVAIIVNEETAGGAELLAFQLARLDRVTTIGVATAGRIGSYRLSAEADRATLIYQPLADSEIDGLPASSLRVVPELEIPYPLTLNTRSDPQFQAAFNVLLGNL